jgi:hypothetical protein
MPQLLADIGARALHFATTDPDRFAIEPKVDGVRGLVVHALSPLVEPLAELPAAMLDGRLEGIVLMDRRLPYAATDSSAGCEDSLTGCRSYGRERCSTAS